LQRDLELVSRDFFFQFLADGAAAALGDVWVALRGSIRNVLEAVTLADIANQSLPKAVQRLVANPDNWESH